MSKLEALARSEMNLGPDLHAGESADDDADAADPGFVILLMYGYRGWALAIFLTAGLTDLFDGLIARTTGEKTTLGAWLDPMADKLLLLTMFVMLSLPGSASPTGCRSGSPSWSSAATWRLSPPWRW